MVMIFVIMEKYKELVCNVMCCCIIIDNKLHDVPVMQKTVTNIMASS
jgi:hypothetical protein